MNQFLQSRNSMSRCHGPKLGICTALVAIGLYFAAGKLVDAAQNENNAEQGQVLTRGPVHEAFAETVSFNPEPGIVAPKSPPDPIEELPPDQKPEGDNVAWIPGYWGWDDDRSDFVWVSGIWRALPPGRQWVPGYWNQSGKGYQWTSGYWSDGRTSEVQYLPEPPQTVEAGPNIEAPSPDQSWIPGNWAWRGGRYAWRPGYWAGVQPDWVWTPAYYIWTPRGYVFVDGYWDYAVARRGLLFAPVYFQPDVYAQPGFIYSPATLISLAVFGDQLFLRPRYHHYYFGDYYAGNYSNSGFYPWFSFHNHQGYDPFYAHERWEHRQDRDWERHVADQFQYRRDHEDARPPRTLEAQTKLGVGRINSTDRGPMVAMSLDQLAKSKEGAMRLQPVGKEERQKLGQREQDIQKFRQQRQMLETKTAGTSATGPSKQLKPTTAKLPTSPFVAKSVDQLGKDAAPPKTLGVPRINQQVESKSRVNQSPEQKRPTTINRSPLATDPRQSNAPSQGMTTHPGADQPATSSKAGGVSPKLGARQPSPAAQPSGDQVPLKSQLKSPPQQPTHTNGNRPFRIDPRGTQSQSQQTKQFLPQAPTQSGIAGQGPQGPSQPNAIRQTPSRVDQFRSQSQMPPRMNQLAPQQSTQPNNFRQTPTRFGPQMQTPPQGNFNRPPQNPRSSRPTDPQSNGPQQQNH